MLCTGTCYALFAARRAPQFLSPIPPGNFRHASRRLYALRHLCLPQSPCKEGRLLPALPLAPVEWRRASSPASNPPHTPAPPIYQSPTLAIAPLLSLLPPACHPAPHLPPPTLIPSAPSPWFCCALGSHSTLTSTNRPQHQPPTLPALNHRPRPRLASRLLSAATPHCVAAPGPAPQCAPVSPSLLHHAPPAPPHFLTRPRGPLPALLAPPFD